MSIIEYLGDYWLLIIILGLVGIKFSLIALERYANKKLDQQPNLTEKEFSQTFAIIGIIFTLIFVSTGYYFWETNHKLIQMPLFIGLTGIGIFFMFYGKFTKHFLKMK